MTFIDIDALRAYLLDYCGTAMFGGFSAALLDVADIERASGHELCRIAERLVSICGASRWMRASVDVGYLARS